MTVTHHPSKATKKAYARAELGPGAALVVACHLEMCAPCALEVEAVQSVEGVVLVDGAFPLAGQGGPIPLATRTDSLPGQPAWMPRALRDAKVGPWLWAGPGLRLARMQRSAGLGEWLYLFRAKTGGKLPRHGHSGMERLILLDGAFSDGGEVFRRGDLTEFDENHEHQPIADQGVGCVCMIATDGPLKLSGPARLLQPFLGV